ncbi:hypothetical protein DN752_10015 [Echinicola strongylocentroti]|uniref:Type II toxin-antitoxin system RelE/ParE family toxin n=1 Tax=Echinicola strongylocentroti TaxID=1795355 RepID=A0A2Z4IIA8_9BACT|nr:type II toxin-antitoxin system RelE/ParE family toxin [Echinicola strongylocentroti]AWW30430.1 hypothetical protein DN752_10015 [Echinicola strongylocentroti]
MKVVFTKSASERLRKIHSYYKHRVNQRTANKIITQILKSAKSLHSNPGKGSIEEILEPLGQGHRKIIEGNYKIIYRVVTSAVVITDIFDIRRNPGKMKP